MAEERRDDGRGEGGRRGPEGRPDGRPEGGRSDEGRRRSGRRHGFRGGRPGGGQQGQQGQPGQPPRQGQPAEPRPQAPAGEARPPLPQDKRELPICPLCGRPLYDLSTALAADKEKGEPAHFDCVLERVTAAESLGPGEKLVYLGSGAFGVVEFKDRAESAFTVKRRIQWEKEGEKRDWRRSLSSRIANL